MFLHEFPSTELRSHPSTPSTSSGQRCVARSTVLTPKSQGPSFDCYGRSIELTPKAQKPIIHSRWLIHGWPELLLLIKKDVQLIHPPCRPQQNLNKQVLREYEMKTDRIGDGLLIWQWFQVLLKSQIRKALRFDKAYHW